MTINSFLKQVSSGSPFHYLERKISFVHHKWSMEGLQSCNETFLYRMAPSCFFNISAQNYRGMPPWPLLGEMTEV